MRAKSVVLAMLVGLLAAACGGSSSGGSSGGTVAGVKANIHGTKDVSAGGTVDLEVDTYYFSPSVLKGKPGEKLTLNITNDGSTEHNFTIDDQNINKDIHGNGSATVSVTFPDSGVLSFYCEYHKDRGMAGGLLVSGNASG